VTIYRRSEITDSFLKISNIDIIVYFISTVFDESEISFDSTIITSTILISRID